MNKMKTIIKILAVISIIMILQGCETYKDYEIEYTPVYPLSGEWYVRFTDISVTPNVTSGLILVSTYNTSDNSMNQMWIRATSSSTLYTGRFTGKINCDVGNLSFGGDIVTNTYYTTTPTPTFSITEGKVELNGYNTATGGKSDKISFRMTDTRKAGKTYTVSGFRRTAWPDDQV
jgi:hypothetical protein